MRCYFTLLLAGLVLAGSLDSSEARDRERSDTRDRERSELEEDLRNVEPGSAKWNRILRRAERRAARAGKQEELPLPESAENKPGSTHSLLTARPGFRSVFAPPHLVPTAGASEKGNGEPASAGKGTAPPEDPPKAHAEMELLPFGEPVPGKPGFVTLTGNHRNLPLIDVRGIASGTPVEIPDPDKPGGSIRFRVP